MVAPSGDPLSADPFFGTKGRPAPKPITIGGVRTSFSLYDRAASAFGVRDRRRQKKGVAFAYDPAVHVVGDTGFEPVTPAV